MKCRLSTGLAALSLLVATPAMADITIIDGGVPGNPAQNVLLQNNSTGLVIVGQTNITNTSIRFRGNELLKDPPNGQARIEAVVGGFNFLEISLPNPLLFFTAMEFNINSDFDGDVTISTTDQFGNPFSGTFTVDDNGQNFFNLVTTNNQGFNLVRIEAAGSLESVGQVRVEGRPGFANPTPFAVVPEPGAWALMLVGFFGAGSALRARRRRAAAS